MAGMARRRTTGLDGKLPLAQEGSKAAALLRARSTQRFNCSGGERSSFHGGWLDSEPLAIGNNARQIGVHLVGGDLRTRARLPHGGNILGAQCAGIIELAENAPCVRFVIGFLSIPLKLAIKVGVPKLRPQRHVFGNLTGHCGLPNICSRAPELWLAERRAWRWGKARAAPRKQCSYFMETMVDARSFLLTLHNRS